MLHVSVYISVVYLYVLVLKTASIGVHTVTPKIVGVSNIYACVCVCKLKGIPEIVDSGGVDLGIHSVEKPTRGVKMEKC